VALLCILPCILFGNGNNEKKELVVPDEFSDFHLILNSRVPKDVLKQFWYDDSEEAYYYRSKANEKLFREMFLYLKWGKLKKVEIFSHVYLQEPDLKFYPPERILEICYNEYGIIETSFSREYYSSKPNSIPTTLRIKYNVDKWVINKMAVEFLYLSFEKFKELKNNMEDEVEILYEIIYSAE
jgi:hypothetical protein